MKDPITAFEEMQENFNAPMDEMDKVETYLKAHGFVYDRRPVHGGEQIRVFPSEDSPRDYAHYLWDVICTPFSDGGEEGLLEQMGLSKTEEVTGISRVMM